jgi:hypothetical protein
MWGSQLNGQAEWIKVWCFFALEDGITFNENTKCFIEFMVWVLLCVSKNVSWPLKVGWTALWDFGGSICGMGCMAFPTLFTAIRKTTHEEKCKFLK